MALRFLNTPLTGEESHMDDDRDLNKRGSENETKGNLEQAKGKVKEGYGKVTGDRSTETSGKMDQAKGKFKEGMGETERKIDDALDR